MEGGGIFLDSDSEPCGAAAATGVLKTKRGKTVMGDSGSVGLQGAQKKRLTDITNMQQEQQQQQNLKTFNQQEKNLSAPLAAADISTDQLLSENAMLLKVLANRNAIIESCKAELQKSQSNFQKLQKQNTELALTNSRMLSELNSSRQRLRELQLEVGSKNGVIKALKLELMEKERKEKLKPERDANEVLASQSKQPDQAFQEYNKEDDLCHVKRKRVSRSQSSAPAVVKQVKSSEMVDNKKCRLRRQSAGLKAEKPGPTQDSFKVDKKKCDVSHLQENLANENGPTSLRSEVLEEGREDTESSGPTNTEQVHTKVTIEKKRQSLRRQSARFKPEDPEPTEDHFEIDDANFALPRLCDNMSEKSCPSTSSVTSAQENQENNSYTSDPQQTRRSSVGRPMRRTVEKVQSYREVPLNVKMRRPT